MHQRRIKTHMRQLGLMLSLAVLIVAISCKEDPPLSFDATVSGTITDRITNDPIENVNVILEQGNTRIGDGLTNSSGVYSITETVSGAENFTISVETPAGYQDVDSENITLNAGDNQETINFQLDPENPVLSISYPGGGNALILQGDQLEGSVNVQNSNNAGDLSYTNLISDDWIDATNPDGTKSGTIGRGNTIVISVSLIAAEIEALSLNDGQTINGTIAIQADSEQTVDGTREINVQYTYAAPNEAPEGEISISPSKSSYLMRELINIEAVNLSDDRDTPSELAVAWRSEGGTIDNSASTATTVRYDSPGTYTLTLDITDTEGATTSVPATIVVSANQNPSGGSFNIDLSASELFVNVPITFSAVSWTDDQVGELDQLSYTWDFGDGTITSASPSNVSISHTYSAERSAMVVLTVTDLDGGTGTATNTFTINPVGQPTASIESIPATDIGSNFVIAEGAITDLGNGSSGVTEYGFVYGTTSDPTVDDNKLNLGAADGPTAFVSRIDNLTSTTTYFIRAYVINESGMPAYSSEIDFRTTIPVAPSPASVYIITNITQTTATVTVDVDNLGVGVTASEVGVVINVNSAGDPDLSNFDFKESSSSLSVGQSDFTVSGLASGTSYRVRAYITTSDGSTLSTTQVFTTN